jgi:hypothetical protein
MHYDDIDCFHSSLSWFEGTNAISTISQPHGRTFLFLLQHFWSRCKPFFVARVYVVLLLLDRRVEYDGGALKACVFEV